MDNSGWNLRNLVLRFLDSLVRLYPSRFRSEFSSEIREVILGRVREAEERGWRAWFSTVFQEITGLVPSIVHECWHEFGFHKGRAMASELHLQKDGLHGTIAYLRWAEPPLWKVTLADFLPLWLFSFTLMGISIGPFQIGPRLAGAAFLLAVAATILLLWMGWFTPELVLYSLFLIIPTFIFEEVSPAYKLSFFLLFTLVLTVGIAGYRLGLHNDSIGMGWLILLAVFIGTWMLASHADQNYWQMANATPWWILFFSP